MIILVEWDKKHILFKKEKKKAWEISYWYIRERDRKRKKMVTVWKKWILPSIQKLNLCLDLLSFNLMV